jgi:hypothetical protein
MTECFAKEGSGFGSGGQVLGVARYSSHRSPHINLIFKTKLHARSWKLAQKPVGLLYLWLFYVFWPHSLQPCPIEHKSPSKLPIQAMFSVKIFTPSQSLATCVKVSNWCVTVTWVCRIERNGTVVDSATLRDAMANTIVLVKVASFVLWCSSLSHHQFCMTKIGRPNPDQFSISLTKLILLGIGTFLSDRFLFTQKLSEL